MTDPFPPALGISMGKPTAQIVTISHKSPHHSYTEGVAGLPRLVQGPGEYEIADVLIGGVATSSEPNHGAINTAYVLRFDDVTVCHLGDISDKLNNAQIEDLGGIDVLLVPVGGAQALGPTEAAEVISQLEPSIVIPMHYRIDGIKVEGLETVETFCREMGLKEFAPEPKLSVTKSSLPSEVRVVVLEHKRV